uniref:Uncharacterized protein n=1 Tax=Ailuropoda melanoleuca TaxID=9646 RepID=G1MM48_AILME
MESEKRLMDTKQNWMFSDSKRYVMDSDMDRDGMDSASASEVHLMGEEKHQEKIRFKRYIMDSDSEPCEMDSDSERYGLASAAVEYVMDASTDTEEHWMDSWSEKHTVDLDSESLGIVSDSAKHMIKAEDCQKASDLERFWMGIRFESKRFLTDSERQKLDFDSGRCRDSFRRYQFRSERLQRSSGKYRDGLQKHWDSFERHQIDSSSGKYLAKSESERYQSEFESETHMIEMEKEQCLIFENKRLQMDEEMKRSLIHHIDSENEAQRLGARKKGNRPQGFWRPIFPSPPCSQRKETEVQNSVQQIDNKVSRIQLVRYLSDDKIVRSKEVSPTLSDNQSSQKKLKEKHRHSLSPDPDTVMDKKHHRIARHPKPHRNNTYSLDTGAPICPKCFMEINNSFHKCLVNSDDDSDPDSTLHLQIPLDSKYSLSPESIRHHKTSRNSPLSRSLDPKHPVGIHCPLHQEDSKYSLGSTSYLHCESCSALQNLIGSTATSTFPMNPQNTMGHHSTPDLDSVINTSNVPGLENEDKFNLTAKLENEAKPDNETKLISAGNLKDKASAKEKPLLKDETDHEDETDSEDDKDPEDEIDSKDDNTKDKKDPKDKSDPDDNDPKDSNAEKDADTNNGSDPSGDADPTSGADSNSDGDSNNGSDSNGEPESNTDNTTNNDANSKYSSDSDGEKHTNNSDSTSGLNNGVDQDCTANSNNGTNTNDSSGLQNGTGLDYTSGSNNGAGPQNRPGSKINTYGLQNNTSDPQNIRSDPDIPESINNGSGPNINGPGPNNNGSGLKIDPDSNYNVRPSNATSHSSAISSNKYADSKYDTKPTTATGHNYAAVPKCASDLDCVSGFTHAVGSSLLLNSNHIARNNYAAKPSSKATTVNATDTSSTTSCSGAISLSYNAGTSCASGTNHDPRLTHVFGSNLVTNPNYDATNTHNVHNSTNTSNINNLSEPELEISTSSSIPNIVNGNSPAFAASTNYICTSGNLTTSEFSDPSKLGINYTIFDNHKFGACLKDTAGSMDSVSLKHTTESKDVLDAKESGFLKDFSRVWNPIGIKDLTNLSFHSNSNIPLPSFDIIVEAEPPNVVKFAVSSGAVNQFFKVSLYKCRL